MKTRQYLQAFLRKIKHPEPSFVHEFKSVKQIQSKKIVYVDLDGVCADLKKLADKKLKQNPLMIYPQAEYGFFMEMEEIKDAVSAVKTLAEHYDVWFLSAPSYKNPLCLAEKNYWVRNHFGPEWPERLILSSNKALLKGHYLIDDNITGRNQENFEGKFVHFGSPTFSTWTKVMEFFMFEIEYDLAKDQNNKKNTLI